MDTPVFPRRKLIFTASAATAAALLPMQQSVAQVARAGGDWFAMVKAHHALVAETFEALLKSGDGLHSRRERLVRTLGFQLTAHSVAEENVLYPALAMAGLRTESDKLYLDQAHAKVMNAELTLLTGAKTGGAPWLAKVRDMQTAVLKHAKQDEEADLYPRRKTRSIRSRTSRNSHR
jgi:hemerythrin superfamily protein